MLVRTLVASSVAVLASLLVVGCAEDGSTTGKGKNNIDGTTGETKGGVCAASAEWKSSCATAPSACDDSIVSTCSDVTSLLNPGILEGAKSCLDESKCSVSPTKCLAKAVAGAKKTEAHTKLAKGFCGCLMVGADACIGAIEAGDGPSKLAMTIALPLSDELADAITDTCTTTPGCSATFSACAQGVVTKKIAEKLSVEAAGCVAKSVLSAAKGAASGDGAGDGDGDGDGGGDGDVTDPDGDSTPSDPSCTPKTCEDYEGACGQHDNGCGGKVTCGQCAPACTPKTCDQLNKECGTHNNGCGGTVNCGLCPTNPNDNCAGLDTYEPNNTKNTARNLGEAWDAPNTTKSTGTLSLSDGDEDWFRLRVGDSGFGGNPRIDVTSSGAKPEITIFHNCDSLPNYSTCTSTGTQDSELGIGSCRGSQGKVSLSTECSGMTETGDTFIRVRKTQSDGTCAVYSLNIEVY